MRSRKLIKEFCEVCGNTDKEVLHAHHIVERTEMNTSNDNFNLAILCSNCHNKVHSGKIKIIGVYPSTAKYGRKLIYELDGVPNVPGISEPFYKHKSKRMKVYLDEE